MFIDTVTGMTGAVAAPQKQAAKVADRQVQTDAVADTTASSVDAKSALRAAVKQIDSYLKSTGRAVEFRVDEDTETTVVTVRDTATGEVIRQIPSEEALQLARHLERGSAALLDLTA
jgi:flagellar protein FlaG